MIEFKEATYDAGIEVLRNLRGPQRRTIEKLRLDAPRLLKQAIGNGFPNFCAYVGGSPAAIFGGHAESLLGETRLWMLTTGLVESHKVPLLRYSRRFVKAMFEAYGPVIGACDVEFRESEAWLRWLGFKEVSRGEYIIMRYSGGH